MIEAVLMDDLALGRLIIARGLLPAEQVRRVYDSLLPGATLSGALVASGLLDPAQLEALLRQESGRQPLPSPAPEAGPADLPRTGERVDGRYRVEGVLGRGGMGAVLRAWDETRDVSVALKVLLDPGAAQQLERFEREAHIAAKVDEEGVVRVQALGSWKGRPYCAMELIAGRDLAQVYAEALPDPRELARLLAGVARTLGRVHAAGVVHRDLKPANLLLADGSKRLKVADFGLARDESLERLTQTGQLLGTPAFCAPEQADAASAVDGRADLYSLGAVLYQGLSGRPPFAGAPHQILRALFLEDPPRPSSLRAGVPAELEAICLKAMAKEPSERYPDAAALAEELERFARGEAVGARAPSGWDRLRAQARRGEPRARATLRALQGLALVGLLVLSAGTFGLLRLRAHETLTAHDAWAGQHLAPYELGVLGQTPSFSPAELDAQDAALRGARFWASSARQAAIEAARARLAAHRRLLAGDSGPPVPGGDAPRDPGLEGLVDAILLLKSGDARRALRRVERLVAPERGELRSFVPARLFWLRLQAQLAPREFLGTAEGLLDAAPEGRVAEVVRTLARDVLWRRYLVELGQAPARGRAETEAALGPLIAAAAGLGLALDELAEAKQATLEASAPAWEAEARRAQTALLAGERRRLDELVLRVGDLVQRLAPPVRPGPRLDAVLDQVLRGVLAAYAGETRPARRRLLGQAALELGQTLYYAVDPTRADPPEYTRLLSDLVTLGYERRVSVELPLAVLRAYTGPEGAVPSPRRLLARLHPDGPGRDAAVIRDLEALARERPRSRALLFAQLVVRLDRNEHKGRGVAPSERGAACERLIALGRRIVKDASLLGDLSPIYRSDAALALAKVLVGRHLLGEELEAARRRTLLTEAVTRCRAARAGIAAMHRFETYEQESRAHEGLGGFAAMADLWEEAVADFRERARRPPTGEVAQAALLSQHELQSLCRSLRSLSGAQLALGDLDAAQAAAEEELAIARELDGGGYSGELADGRASLVGVLRRRQDYAAAEALLAEGLPADLSDHDFACEYVRVPLARGELAEAERRLSIILREPGREQISAVRSLRDQLAGSRAKERER